MSKYQDVWKFKNVLLNDMSVKEETLGKKIFLTIYNYMNEGIID